MVGVPTSNRCDNCRKRKKKCDERTPSCSECVRGGWNCPGYKPKWKFVDEAPRLLEHYSGRKFIFEEIEVSSEDESSKAIEGNTRRRRAVVKRNSSHDSYRNSFNLFDRTTVPRNPRSDHLRSALVYCLGSKVTGALIPLRFVGSFFEFIPARLGHSAALDHAVWCLCALYQSRPPNPYHFNKRVCQSYIKSLSALRYCLDDELLRMESETLCASILLQMCELNVNFDRGKWGQLSHGTAFLLQYRGVSRYMNAFDYAMLESQVSFVIRQAIESREHCFLGYPEWQCLLLQGLPGTFSTPQPLGLTLRLRLHALMVDVPNLMIECSAIGRSWTSQSGWETRLELLIRRASTKFDDVKKWLTVEAEPLFLAQSSTQETIEKRMQYPDMMCGLLDTVANTLLLILDKALGFLYQLRLRATSENGRVTGLWLERELFLSDSEDAERYQRVMKAFDFVKGESDLAAKPLQLGLQALHASIASCSIDITR